MSAVSQPFIPTDPTGPGGAPSGPPPADAGPSRVPLLTGVTALCVAVLALVTSLRLYTRHFLLRTLGPDDALALVSTLCVVTVGILYLVHTQYGLGSHVWETTNPADVTTGLQLVYVEGVLYNICLMLIKITLFAQYYRLIAQTTHRIPCLIIAMLVITWCLAMTLIVVFACIPIESTWDFTITEKDCSLASRGILIAVGNIVTDFTLLFLPIPIVWKLKMKAAQKMAILGIFSIGLFSCTVSIIRVTLLSITPDFTYSATIIDCWTIGELSAACCCPSLMVLQPFVKKLGINLSSFRRASQKPYNTPSRSGPSTRRIGSQPSMPRNVHGSEVELCSVNPPANYDDRYVASRAV